MNFALGGLQSKFDTPKLNPTVKTVLNLFENEHAKSGNIGYTVLLPTVRLFHARLLVCHTTIFE